MKDIIFWLKFLNIFYATLMIWGNKFRAFLTTLGVIVGAATIVLVVAVGKGGEAQVAEQFSKLNVGTIFVMPMNGQKIVSPLNKEDARMIGELPTIVAATAYLSGKGNMTYADVSYQGGLIGALPEFQPLNNLKLQKGNFITEQDDKDRKRLAVIGTDLAETLFGADATNIVGEYITINNRKFEIIGLLARVGDSTGGINIDDSAIVPYEVAQKYLLGSQVNPRIIALANNLENVPSAMKEISSVLNTNHRIGGSSQFNIRDAGSRLAAAQSTAKTMSVLLIIVAIIVLIVGGIGIMNVMFVTVKERTREIGTLKAIGAKRKEILRQFLLESVLISFVGGILGVVLGIIAMPLTAYFDLKAVPSAAGVFLGIIFSLVTGTFFGYYPAMKAARLHPIEALRYE
ncbi:MAG: FtsX-like permease family protein [Peptococcaceae bacterium]|nr:FtsX-like permease family protein [Peptococcaceae bacterium]